MKKIILIIVVCLSTIIVQAQSNNIGNYLNFTNLVVGVFKDTSDSVDYAKCYPTSIEVYFAPNEQCENKIVSLLDSSTNSIYIQAYVLSSKPILVAITNAQSRGVNIEIILDKKMWDVSASWWLIQNNIKVRADNKHAIAHNKVMIIDSNTVITGSYNYTHNAQYNNAENLAIISSNKSISDRYMNNYLLHQSHSPLWTNGIPSNVVIKVVK